jgi:hypothetical protein
MSFESALSSIVREVASLACARMTRRIIKQLRQMDDAMMSGDDSGLKNSWEEVCVQMQGEQSYCWEVFEETIRHFLRDEVTKLPPHEHQAVWLQTENGLEWLDLGDECSKSVPYSEDDIAQYVLDEYVLPTAGDYSNPRIRKYLDVESQ